MVKNILFSPMNSIGTLSNTVFIIDTYHPFSPYNDNVRFTFWLHDNSYAIKEVKCTWGKPIVPTLIDEEVRPEWFYLYDTFEDAMTYVHTIQRLNK